jgi:hypothetical protein
MNGLTIDDFTPHAGKLFLPEGGAFGLVLVRVEPAPPGFVLLFRGPGAAVLPAGVYHFTLEDGAAFAFHLMPIHTPLPDQQDYQAVFN